jgi:hypothetical protein
MEASYNLTLKCFLSANLLLSLAYLFWTAFLSARRAAKPTRREITLPRRTEEETLS